MGFWTTLCGDPEQLHEPGNKCCSHPPAIINRYSCSYHMLVISIDILLFIIALVILVFQVFSKKFGHSPGSLGHPTISIMSAIYNGCRGFVYIAFGIWKVEQKVEKEDTVLPVHGWLVLLTQGFTWLLITLFIGLCRLHIPFMVKSYSISAILVAGFLCSMSIWTILGNKFVVAKAVLDILSFLGAILLILSAFGRCRGKGSAGDICDDDAFYIALQGAEGSASPETVNSKENLTPLSDAGILSKLSFWWLNPLMNTGKWKILEDEDIPQLRKEDQAGKCYLQFSDQLNNLRRKDPTKNPSILQALFLCQWKAILVSGFFD